MTTGKHTLTDNDGEVRELRGSDFKRARKASEVFPKSLQAKLGVLGERPVSSDVQARAGNTGHGVGVEFGFCKVGEKAAQKFEGELKSATDSLVSNIPANLSLKTENGFPCHSAPAYIAHIDLQLFEAMVRDVLGQYPYTSKCDEHLVWLAASGDSVPHNARRLERMSRREMAELVQAQSEALERFKALFTAVSVGVLEGGASKLNSLSAESGRGALAKRLREIAEDVEMSTLHVSSRG